MSSSEIAILQERIRGLQESNAKLAATVKTREKQYDAERAVGAQLHAQLVEAQDLITSDAHKYSVTVGRLRDTNRRLESQLGLSRLPPAVSGTAEYEKAQHEQALRELTESNNHWRGQYRREVLNVELEQRKVAHLQDIFSLYLFGIADAIGLQHPDQMQVGSSEFHAWMRALTDAVHE